jgi:hypothetical protein
MIRRRPQVFRTVLRPLAVAIACLPWALLIPPGAAAFEFRPDADLDATIPTPEAFLGHAVGDRPIRHAEVTRYLEVLAEASDRVELREYGSTHEGRRLVYAVIALPERIARIDEIRAERDRYADPRLTPDPETGAATLPAVGWMAYSIHGDELSSTDAAIQLAYELAAGRDAAVTAILDSVIVIVDPLQNPDGRERYLSQLEFLNGVVENPDPASLHHTAFWPWGRGNHYLADLNRDWFPQVHPESRARIAALREWKPQLVVDSHEMGTASTYLFPPPRAPFNPHMHGWFWKWLDRFSADHAAAFDRHGWSYYTREWNEEWFPGYGSSWVAFQGAIGILYEQSSTSGRVVKRPDGMEVDFRTAVHHQIVSSLANLTTLAHERRAILLDYHRGRREAVERGRRGDLRALLFAPSPNVDRIHRLAAVLENQGVEVHRAAEAFSASDLHDVWGEEKSIELPPGTLLVRLDQPLEPLIRATAEFHTQMSDSFLSSEREQLETRNETRLYEVTAWSLPVAYGVETYWTGRIPSAGWERVGPPPADWITSIVSEGPFPSGGSPPGLEGDWPAYAIVAHAGQEKVLAAAARLMDSGFSVRVAEEEFRAGGVDYPPGTILLRREANADSLADVVRRVAEETGTRFRTVASARSEAGPDLGGDKFRTLVPPRIAILAGTPLSTSQYGSVWHLFDRELGLRVSSLDVARVASTDLRRYNVLILPPAWGGRSPYRRALGHDGVESIREWVEDGGTLVGMSTGAAFLADSSSAFSRVLLRRQVTEKHPAPERGIPYAVGRRLYLSEAMGLDDEIDEGSPPELPEAFGVPGPGDPVIGPGARAFAADVGERSRAENTRPTSDADDAEGEAATTPEKPDAETLLSIDERLRRFRPRGAILRVDLDPRRWLAFGLPERVAATVHTSYAYLASDPVETVGRFAGYDELHVSGLLWPEAAGRWAHTAYATREAKGRGQVILFAGNPVFRSYFLGTRRLLLNAAILGPGMGAAAEPPY